MYNKRICCKEKEKQQDLPPPGKEKFNDENKSEISFIQEQQVGLNCTEVLICESSHKFSEVDKVRRLN